MANILLWDFALGLKVEEQIKHMFESSVHYDHDPKTKEFFLVVSFSSTFPLSQWNLWVWCYNVALVVEH